MYRLLTEPDNFMHTLEDMCSKVMTTMTWDNPSVSEYNIGSAWGLLTQMSPAGPITNVLTPLWHLPEFMNPWKKAEHKRHDEQQAFWMDRLMEVRAKMKDGLQRPCWARQYIETEKTQKLSGDYEASSVIGMLCLVGVFTVGGPLSYFLMCMVHHPEWQRKCQEEIDRVCGGRMPTLNDSPNLPVLRACIKETMRWKPNVPSGKHKAFEINSDTNICEVLLTRLKLMISIAAISFPKEPVFYPSTGNAALTWNVKCIADSDHRAFLRNPVKYPDPDNYHPERWLDSRWPTYQEPLTQYPNVKGFTSFGWGQRQCLGQTLTQDELLVACGAVCWSYNMDFKVDPATGKKIDIPLNKSNSLLIIKPDPYQMTFEPRSENRRQQIIDQWKKADERDREERAAFICAAKISRA